MNTGPLSRSDSLAASAVGLAMPSYAFGQYETPNERINLGFIGVGRMGRGQSRKRDSQD